MVQQLHTSHPRRRPIPPLPSSPPVRNRRRPDTSARPIPPPSGSPAAPIRRTPSTDAVRGCRMRARAPGAGTAPVEGQPEVLATPGGGDELDRVARAASSWRRGAGWYPSSSYTSTGPAGVTARQHSARRPRRHAHSAAPAGPVPARARRVEATDEGGVHGHAGPEHHAELRTLVNSSSTTCPNPPPGTLAASRTCPR